MMHVSSQEKVYMADCGYIYAIGVAGRPLVKIGKTTGAASAAPQKLPLYAVKNDVQCLT
jgi:hypothetical protein